MTEVEHTTAPIAFDHRTPVRDASHALRKRKSPTTFLPDGMTVSPTSRLRGLALETPLVGTTPRTPIPVDTVASPDRRSRPALEHCIFTLDDDDTPTRPPAAAAGGSSQLSFGVARSASSRRWGDGDDDYLSTETSSPTPPEAGARRHVRLASATYARASAIPALTISVPRAGEGPFHSPHLSPSLGRFFGNPDDPLDSLLGLRNGYRAA